MGPPAATAGKVGGKGSWVVFWVIVLLKVTNKTGLLSAPSNVAASRDTWCVSSG